MRFSPENDDLTKNKPNSNPIQSQFVERPKLMQSMYIQRIMKKNADMGQKNKPKTNPIQTQSLTFWALEDSMLFCNFFGVT